MTKKLQPARAAGLSLSSDGAFGLAGGCLAAGALTFGIYMNVRGPAPSLGTSKDFTVFAQLAPSAHRKATPATTDAGTDLDTTATATIPGGDAGAPDAGAATRIIASISLASITDADHATLMIDGRLRRVRVGDEVPGAGEVLAIEPGRRPMVRTARGLIVPAAP